MGFLKDKVAIVVGVSGRGNMGEATAKYLIKEGAKVIVAARREKELKEIADEIGAVSKVCDISKEDQVEALAKFAIEKYGRLDIGVNTAGVSPTGSIATTTAEDLRLASDVHLCGTFFFFKHMSAVMEHGGSLVTVSSITASRFTADYAAYMCTKAGADHLVRVAAIELGPKGIKVNSVSPAFTDDAPMSREYQKIPGLNELFEKEIPLGRLNTVHDVAHAIAWLCHDDSYITGQNIHVSGGNHLTRLPTAAEIGALFEG
jgi:NAD(P)-dependent dehydrogenase (short-subunit alcohol dehydrogenase family)